MNTKFWKTLGAVSALSLTLGVVANAQDAAATQPPPAAGGGARQGRGGGGQGRQGGFGRASAATLPVSYLKATLKLTDDQVKKVTAIQEKAKKDMPVFTRPAQGEQPDPNAMREQFTKMQEVNKKADDDISALLTGEQKDKLPAVMREAQGFQQAGIPMNAIGELKLTDDQMKKITGYVTEMNDKLKDVPREERRAKMQEARTDLQTKVQAVLTDDQKEKLKKIGPGAGGPGGQGGQRRGNRNRPGGAGAGNPPGVE